jgi:ATP-dependent Clp protease ATP-binding subunit ClpC
VNFKNSVIIMTSNIGAQYIEKMEKIGFAKNGDVDAVTAEKENYDETKKKVLGSLKDYFRPEFLNRVDDIILFDILSKESISKIVQIQVDVVVARMKTKDIHLVVLPEVLGYLAKEGYNPQYGARPLKRLIQNKILTPVAGLMISQGVTKDGTITVGLKRVEKNGQKNTDKGTSTIAEKEPEFTFDVKKKKGKEGKEIAKESSVIIRTADLQN